LKRWAERYGVPMVSRLPGADTERLNKGVYFAIQHEVADEYVRIAWNSIWAEGNDPGNRASVDAVAHRMGWNSEDFQAWVGGQDCAALYEADNVAAIAAGVFGVPVMTIGPEMWWGNDRLSFLEAYLADHL
jgi:2-hydroxychromene-2-carboxylate isomerase